MYVVYEKFLKGLTSVWFVWINIYCRICLPVDSGWLNSDADMVDNPLTHCIPEYFSSFHCTMAELTVQVPFAIVSPAFYTWLFDFETICVEKREKSNYTLPYFLHKSSCCCCDETHPNLWKKEDIYELILLWISDSAHNHWRENKFIVDYRQSTDKYLKISHSLSTWRTISDGKIDIQDIHYV